MNLIDRLLVHVLHKELSTLEAPGQIFFSLKVFIYVRHDVSFLYHLYQFYSKSTVILILVPRTFRPDRDGAFRRDRPRSPPVTDSWQPNQRRSPPRRRSPFRRNRTPPGDTWRGRARTPPGRRSPMRRFSPRRDDRRIRSPIRRDERYVFEGSLAFDIVTDILTEDGPDRHLIETVPTCVLGRQ